MPDPLAQFRKAQILPKRDQTESAPEPAPEEDEYRAFHAVDRDQKRLSVRAGGIAWVHATYSFLQYITEDAGRGRMFYIIYGFMVIEVRGRNLSPVVDAIRRDACEYIQQFDPGRWGKPKDAKAPYIDAITFHHGADKRGELLNGKQKEQKAEDA